MSNYMQDRQREVGIINGIVSKRNMQPMKVRWNPSTSVFQSFCSNCKAPKSFEGCKFSVYSGIMVNDVKSWHGSFQTLSACMSFNLRSIDSIVAICFRQRAYLVIADHFAVRNRLLVVRYTVWGMSLKVCQQFQQFGNSCIAREGMTFVQETLFEIPPKQLLTCIILSSFLQHVKLKQTKLCQLRWVQLVPFHHKFLFKRVLDSNQSGSLFLRPSKVQWWRFSSQIKSLSKSVLPKVDSHPVLYGELIIHSNTTQFHFLQNLRSACSYHCASQNVLKCIETKCAGMRILLSSRSLQFAVADGCATARLGNGSSLLVFSSLLVVES